MATSKQDFKQGEDTARRRPLRFAVTEIDQEILRLLVRRHNLLAKMRKNGRLDAVEEKFLREAWQNDVARVSHDADLSGRFFSLMQRVSFLPKPTGSDESPAARKRVAFNLAPSSLPVHLEIDAPISGWHTCAWVYLAAAAGQKLRLCNCLQNDPIIDCIRGLVQMGGAITREDDSVVVRAGEPLLAPDKVIHTGASEFNFYLFVAHYLGRYGRVKLTGSKDLQLADFSALARILPELGGRLVHIVPKSSGLPVRLETSGMLPSGFTADPGFPELFAEALLLAAPFYSAPFTLNLGRLPGRRNILAHVLPLLQACGAVFSMQEDTVSIEPSSVNIPGRPVVPADAELAAFMLALPCALGGKAKLGGVWPDWPETAGVWDICAQVGWRRDKNAFMSSCAEPLKEFCPQIAADACFPVWGESLVACLAACAVLRGGKAAIPTFMLENTDVSDFLSMAGLQANEDGTLAKGEHRSGLSWNAPSPAWAMALAVAACARTDKQGWPLGNPGIVIGLWPKFWSLYNSLPNPQFKKHENAPSPEPKARRRIITSAVAVPPEIREEDWG